MMEITAEIRALIDKAAAGVAVSYTHLDVYKRQDGLSFSEIAALCGCSKVSVYESIDAVRKKFLKFFANYPNE